MKIKAWVELEIVDDDLGIYDDIGHIPFCLFSTKDPDEMETYLINRLDSDQWDDVKEITQLIHKRMPELIWEALGDVPVDDDGNIDTAFLDFPVGTDREEIWEWIEDTYGVPIATLKTCGHKSHEDCMFCTECGECREDLDGNDVCADCRQDKHTYGWNCLLCRGDCLGATPL